MHRHCRALKVVREDVIKVVCVKRGGQGGDLAKSAYNVAATDEEVSRHDAVVLPKKMLQRPSSPSRIMLAVTNMKK
jgi:hypothetical protein